MKDEMFQSDSYYLLVQALYSFSFLGEIDDVFEGRTVAFETEARLRRSKRIPSELHKACAKYGYPFSLSVNFFITFNICIDGENESFRSVFVCIV